MRMGTQQQQNIYMYRDPSCKADLDIWDLPFRSNSKSLDLSYKTGLDFRDCFVRAKTEFYNKRNLICLLILLWTLHSLTF